MTKIPKGKKGIYVLINEEVYNKLMNLIKIKYNRLHGALSAEVEEALEFWLRVQSSSAETNAYISPVAPKVHRGLERIFKVLRELGFFYQFTLNDWIKACAITVGHDPRTYKKYLKYALMFNKIKHVGGDVYQFVEEGESK
jgi:hypothetical protein